MNAIVVDAAGPKERCKCCGAEAETSIRFQGPDADTKAVIDLCGACQNLLGQMLLDGEPHDHSDQLMKEVLRRSSSFR